MVAAWYIVLWRPEEAHVAALRSKVQASQQQVSQLDLRLAVLVAEKKKLPTEQAILDKLTAEVPNTPELNKLVTALSAAASKAGVELNSISSPQPTSYGEASAPSSAAPTGPAVVSLSLSVVGTPGGILRLVRELSAEPRLFVVDQFGLDYAGGTSGGSIAVRTFYAQADANNPA
jgi:Tfp pilus assembly protein PilO